MDKPSPHRVDGVHSAAYDASCQLDEFKLERETVSSTAYLLSTAKPLDECAQDAFRGVAHSLDAIIARMNAESDRLMAICRGSDAVAPVQNDE